MAAKTKLELILEAKNKMKAGLASAKNVVGSKVTEIKSEISSIKDHAVSKAKQGRQDISESVNAYKDKAVSAFKAVKDEIPGISRGLELITNKYLLMAAGVTAVITAGISLSSHLNAVSKDIANDQRTVQASYRISGQELIATTAKIRAVTDTFQQDFNEVTRAGNSLFREFRDQGLTAGDSIDLIKQGLQATNGQLELREIQEYSSQMKTAGLNAQEFLALTVTGRQQGIFDDKAVDAVKEFNLRLREMTPAAKDALKGIGLSPAQILRDLDSGQKRTVDVLRDVSEAMGKVNIQARQTATADLFGGAGEDAGERFLLSLAKTEFSMKSLQVMDEAFIQRQNQKIQLSELIAQKQQQFASVINKYRDQFDILVLKAKVLFYDTIARAIDDVTRFWNEHRRAISLGFDILKAAVLGIGIAFTIMKAPAIAAFLVLKAGALASSAASWTLAGSLRAVGFAILAIPIVGWVAAAVTGIILLYQKTEWFRGLVGGVVNVFKELMTLAKPIAKLILGLTTFNPRLVASSFKELKTAWSTVDIKGSFKKGYDDAIQEIRSEREAEKALAISPDQLSRHPDLAEGSAGGSGVTPFSGVSEFESGKSSRNITVNIDSFNKGGINVMPSETQGMTLEDVERWFNDMMLRTTRNLETSGT